MKKRTAIEKEATIRSAIVKFQQSEKKVKDYLHLFSVVGSETSGDNGVQYSRLEEIMKEEMGEEM
ncbi:hypothetical protein [Bacillus mojavensis]